MISNEQLRRAMIAALEATGADGASIEGTDADVSIRLVFSRKEDGRGSSHGPDGRGPALVASESKSLISNDLLDATKTTTTGAAKPAGGTEAARGEREAYDRGWDGCGGDLLVAADRVYGNTQKEMITAISGVEPMIVEAFTHDDRDMSELPWTHIDEQCGWVVSAWRRAGDECNTPCLVAIWPGVGRDGKRKEVQP
jgi:hypothetical protein